MNCWSMLAGDRYEKVANGLLIKNVTLEDDGEYTCRAEVETDGRYGERKIAVAVHSKLWEQISMLRNRRTNGRTDRQIDRRSAIRNAAF